jgi:MFS family permease
MHKTILSTWPLFFGVAMIMVGNGLQSTLLGIRATLEGFPAFSTGLIMSMYFVGSMLGSHFVPKLIRGVGHIRVFAALASIASTTVLLHGLFVNEGVWAIVRAVTGFSYAGLYIVIESWLNNAAGNESRGKMMATYLVVLYSAMALGQYFLGFADPKDMDLFVITSILVTIAVLPISLSSRPAPHFSAPVKVSIRELFKSSPLGVFGVFASGLNGACLFSMGPVYAAETGMSLPQISTFIASAIVGGVLMQFPIGWLSDRFDRRKVLIAVSAASSAASLFALTASGMNLYALFFAMFLTGGLSLTIYGLSTAHTNDHLLPSQIVAASASMIMVNGVGSVIGPLLCSTLMNIVTPGMLFVMMACTQAAIAVFGLYRALRRAPVPLDHQSHFVPQPSPSSGMVMKQAEDYNNSLKNNTN